MKWFTRKERDHVKESRRNVENELQNLDRELLDLQREEVQLTEDIRAASRAGNDTSVRILAQQMVRLRAHIKLQQTTRAGLSGISATLSAAASTAVVANTTKTANNAMGSMTTSVNPTQMQQNMKEFVRQDVRQQDLQNFMNEALDEDLDEDEETDLVFQELLEEVGTDFIANIGAVPPSLSVAAPPPHQNQLATAGDGESEDILRKLDALKAA